MKTARTFTLITIAICIGFLAARWSQAEPAGKISVKRPMSDDSIASQQLESLVSYLQDTKQTNALKQLNDALIYSDALRVSINLATTVSILQGLRDGQTNEVFKLLESHLDGEVTDFNFCYNDLPAPIQRQMSLVSLQRARDYRAKFPFKHTDQNIDERVANAFKILDEKGAK